MFRKVFSWIFAGIVGFLLVAGVSLAEETFELGVGGVVYSTMNPYPLEKIEIILHETSAKIVLNTNWTEVHDGWSKSYFGLYDRTGYGAWLDQPARVGDEIKIDLISSTGFKMARSHFLTSEDIKYNEVVADFILEDSMPVLKINNYLEERLGQVVSVPVRMSSWTGEGRLTQGSFNKLLFHYDNNNFYVDNIRAGSGVNIEGSEFFFPESNVAVWGSFNKPAKDFLFVDFKIIGGVGDVSYVFLDSVKINSLEWYSHPFNECAIHILPSDEPTHELKIWALAPTARAGGMVLVYFCAWHLEDGEPSQNEIGYLYIDLYVQFDPKILEFVDAVDKSVNIQAELIRSGVVRISGDATSFGSAGLMFVLKMRALGPGATSLSLGEESEVDSLDIALENNPIFFSGKIIILPKGKMTREIPIPLKVKE